MQTSFSVPEQIARGKAQQTINWNQEGTRETLRSSSLPFHPVEERAFVAVASGNKALLRRQLLQAVDLLGEDDTAFPDLVLAPPDAHLHTHVCVVGTVESKRRERDGDTHLKLCQGSLCLTLEAIPELPILLPRKGQRIRACGIQRWDGWHRWQEIHPLLTWEVRP